MQLTFESLAELQDFVSWIGALTPIKTITVGDVSISAPESDPIFKEAIQTLAEEVIATPASQAEQSADNPAEPRRKRRTKAEMEAARAAEIAAEEAPAAPAESTSDAPDSPAVAVAGLSPKADAPADKGDAAEFIKSRLAERPEVSQVEHLNLARTFIGKHGMEKYNASFPLAGLTPNVMGYSPADCATHAAALDFLSLE